MTAAVTAVITTHNARATIRRCLDSLPAAGTFAQVMIVDSGSSDGGLDDLPAHHPGITIERLPKNVGPCATRNVGLRRAATPRVLFIDDDMILSPGLVEKLSEALDSHRDAALAGPTIVFAERPDVIQYAGGAAHFGGLPHLLRLGEAPDRGLAPQEVDVLTAGCLLADRARLLEAGGFDEDYFYLAEDVDLSLRLRQRGCKLVIVPEAVVRNIGGSEGMSLKDAAYPARRVELHSRNRWLLISKLYDPWTIFVLLPGLLVYEAAWLLFAILAGQVKAYAKGKGRAGAVILKRLGARRGRAHKQLPDRLLLGAPPMTFTATALSQPFARRGAVILDGWLRIFWIVLRGALK